MYLETVPREWSKSSSLRRMFDRSNFELLFPDWKTYNESAPSKIFVPNSVKKFSSEKQKLSNKMIRPDLLANTALHFGWHCFREFSLQMKIAAVPLKARVSVYSILLQFVAIPICFSMFSCALELFRFHWNVFVGGSIFKQGCVFFSSCYVMDSSKRFYWQRMSDNMSSNPQNGDWEDTKHNQKMVHQLLKLMTMFDENQINLIYLWR